MSYRTVTLGLVDSVLEMCERDISIRSIAKSLPISRGTITSIIKDPQGYKNRIRGYTRSRLRCVEILDRAIEPYICPSCKYKVIYDPCVICAAKKAKNEREVKWQLQ